MVSAYEGDVGSSDNSMLINRRLQMFYHFAVSHSVLMTIHKTKKFTINVSHASVQVL